MNAFEFIAALAVTVLAPAVAQEAKDNQKSYFDKVVCRIVNTTGTRVPTERACYTNREWRRMAGSSELAHKDMIEGNMVPPRAGK